MAKHLSQSYTARKGQHQDLNPDTPDSNTELFHCAMKVATQGPGSSARVVTGWIFTLESRLSTPPIRTVTYTLHMLSLLPSQ